MIEELLRSKKLKVTRQRVEVLSVISDLGCSSTLKNIINSISDMDISTIYRIISIFEESGVLSKIGGLNENVIYIIPDIHKHYIKCIRCNSVKEIDICPIDLDEYIDGYRIIRHSLVIDGICEKCQNER